MRNISTKSLTAAFAAAVAFCSLNANAADLQPATFDNLPLAPESYWVGDTDNPDYTGGTFRSGSFSFVNSYTPAYGSWGLYGYADLTAHEYTGGYAVSQQMMNCLGGGYKSANYGVCYCDQYVGTATVTLPDFAEDGVNVKGVRLINNAWTYYAILNGDGMSSAFTSGDYLKLTIKGYDKDNNTKDVDFYLADYRSENEADHYVVTDWTFCDLSSLGDVVKLECTMETTKSNQWGPTTPMYFCFDNLGADESFEESGVAYVSAEIDVKVNVTGGVAYLTAPEAFSATATSLDGITATVAADCGEAAIVLPAKGVNIIRVATESGVKTIKVVNK